MEKNKIPSRPVNPPNLCEDCGGYRVPHMQGIHECECLLPHGIAWKYLDNISSQSPLKEHETKQRLALAKDIEAIVAQTIKYSTSITQEPTKEEIEKEVLERYPSVCLDWDAGGAFDKRQGFRDCWKWMRDKTKGNAEEGQLRCSQCKTSVGDKNALDCYGKCHKCTQAF